VRIAGLQILGTTTGNHDIVTTAAVVNLKIGRKLGQIYFSS
jgi:hypothetical protein